MKIAEIIPDLRKRAGAEVFFESLVIALTSNPELEIVVITIWDLIDESFKSLMNNPRIKFYSCGKTKKGIDFKATKRFRCILVKENPDVIHTHRSVALTYFLAFRFKRQSWSYFHTVHNIAEKEAGKYEIFLRKIYVKKRIINHIGISNTISRTIEHIYKFPAITTIYNGIKMPILPANEKIFDFICVARFSKQKNHKLLLEAFKEVVISHPDVTLLLVGDGELKKECEALASELKLKNVIFYGSSPDAIELINKSRFFILTSLYEGNPISILEALSLGLPIIAPRVGGVPDVVKNEINGLLFRKGDITEVVSIMNTLLDDQTIGSQISKNNNLEKYNYSIDKCAKEYCDLFLKSKNHNK